MRRGAESGVGQAGASAPMREYMAGTITAVEYVRSIHLGAAATSRRELGLRPHSPETAGPDPAGGQRD